MCAVLRPADSHIVRLANVGALAYPGTASAEAPVFSLLAATVTTAALAETIVRTSLISAAPIPAREVVAPATTLARSQAIAATALAIEFSVCRNSRIGEKTK